MDRSTRERAAAFGLMRRIGAGKLEVLPRFTVSNLDEIAALYTPGVGYLVNEIVARPEAISELTGRDNTIAVVSDGTAVLGLGNAGPHAALPVMEGKASMFKLLVGIDAIPLCVATNGADQLVALLQAVEPSFGGFNLEDVGAPVCFEVMDKAVGRLTVPIIHDDQYGTATVVVAGLINAWKVVGRKPSHERVVVCGDGAAGTATVNLLLEFGVQDITVVGLSGIIGRHFDYPDPHRQQLANRTNRAGLRGGLADAMRGASTFVGLSAGGIVSGEMVRLMAPDPIIFAMANPVPEIMPEMAKEGGAAVVATGRFDYPNQCNNVLAFPGLMRAALDTKALRIPLAACLSAAAAIAQDVPDSALSPDNILPTPLSDTLYPKVADATAQSLIRLGLAQRKYAVGEVAQRTRQLRAAVMARQSSVQASNASEPSSQ
jgi:malate dehydrogenase (oxaloacetate-decarboxylating)